MVYDFFMLTKVIIILVLLILVFGFGKDKRTNARNKMTNMLLALVAFMVAILILTSLFK